MLKLVFMFLFQKVCNLHFMVFPVANYIHTKEGNISFFLILLLQATFKGGNKSATFACGVKKVSKRPLQIV